MRMLVALAAICCLAGAYAGEGKTIHHSKPTLKPKDHKAWAEKGRIVGPIRQCPGCEIDVLDAEGKTIKSVRIPEGGQGYEIEWLLPGTYTMRVAAKGYTPLELKELVVKARHDLWIVLEF